MKTAKAKEVREHPILFSAPMVRAILEGRKTQTRRVVNPQPRSTHSKPCGGCARNGAIVWHWFDDSLSSDTDKRKCPYGKSGDRLWVRETWTRYAFRKRPERVVYAADDELFGVKWKPSIFMPRELSRLTLEITDVRVERLQKISEADQIAEGAERFCPAHPSCTSFAIGWDGLNAKRGYSWESNPWVWVISFQRSSTALRGPNE